MARRPQGPIVNRRHVARLEREKQQAKVIQITTIVILALVGVMVIAGLIYDRIIVANQPVAVVNGEEISTKAFQARVRYERNTLVNRYLNTAQTAQSFGSDEQFLGFFQNQLNQIELQLAPQSLGRDVLNAMIEDKIIRQKAAEMGIVVTQEEVQKALDEFFGYYGGEQPPTATTVPTTAPTSTLSPLQMTLTAPTATPVLTVTETTTETVEIEATPEPTATPEATATPDPDVPTPTATVPPPTPTPFTLESYQTEFKETLQYLRSQLSFTENDLRYLLEGQLYRQKVLEVITADLPREAEQVWARHILVEDEATAQTVLARLEAGEAFATLAAEFSTDSSNAQQGGDLGWFSLGDMVADFEKVAFNLDIGQISTPVQTTFGWHIIQVLGHELRPLSASEYEQAKAEKFDQWLTQQRQLMDAGITILDYWADRVPTTPSVQHVDLQSIVAPPQLEVPTEAP